METFRIDHWRLNQATSSLGKWQSSRSSTERFGVTEVALMKQGCMMTPSGWRMNAEDCFLNSRVLLLLAVYQLRITNGHRYLMCVWVDHDSIVGGGLNPSSSLFNDDRLSFVKLSPWSAQFVYVCCLLRKGVNTDSTDSTSIRRYSTPTGKHLKCRGQSGPQDIGKTPCFATFRALFGPVNLLSSCFLFTLPTAVAASVHQAEVLTSKLPSIMIPLRGIFMNECDPNHSTDHLCTNTQMFRSDIFLTIYRAEDCFFFACAGLLGKPCFSGGI